MPVNLKDALKDIKEISMSDSALKTILDFVGVLDRLDVFMYKNWLHGELVSGPIYEKYYITATFMWDYEKMPDPTAGEVLLQYHCHVKYKKDFLIKAVKVKSENDYKPGTKMPKTIDIPVWLVTVSIPKELIDNVEQSSMSLESSKQSIVQLKTSSTPADNSDERST